MQILGVPVFLGNFEYRREAIAAEQTALTIRKTLERAMAIKPAKEQSKQISFNIENQSEEQAA
jgi:hypothetical protein